MTEVTEKVVLSKKATLLLISLKVDTVDGRNPAPPGMYKTL